jgi:hypothetical protein
MANGKKKNGNGDIAKQGAFDPLALQTKDLPEWMRGEAGRGLEQITAADVEVPRIKLLQALSPELKAHDDLRAGMWYHTVADQGLGRKLTVIPVYIDQSFILWRPRKSGGGILARAMDGIHWTPANVEFKVKLDNGGDATWKTAHTVSKSGLAEWGSTDPKDPSSPPAATRMYNIAVVILDAPQLSPAVVTMQRASIKVARKFLAKLRLATATMPLFGLMLELGAEEAKNAQGQDYMAPTWSMAGLVRDQKTYEVCRSLYERFHNLGLQIRDVEKAQDDDTPEMGRDDAAAAAQNKF